jgi:hypothetical protein
MSAIRKMSSRSFQATATIDAQANWQLQLTTALPLQFGCRHLLELRRAKVIEPKRH